jgi:hypothetical protein
LGVSALATVVFPTLGVPVIRMIFLVMI